MRIFSNLAISLDGRIADLAHPARPLGTPLDRQTMQVIRRQCDAVIVGAESFRVHPVLVKVKGAAKQPINVIISKSGRLPTRRQFWEDPEVVRIVLTTHEGEREARKRSRDRAFVWVLDKHEIKIKSVITELKTLGVQNLLVEGGGTLMAAFLKERYLQELYVTLTPWLLGGRHNPSLVMGEQTLRPWTKLILLKQKRIKNEIYLHYKVQGARRV